MQLPWWRILFELFGVAVVNITSHYTSPIAYKYLDLAHTGWLATGFTVAVIKEDIMLTATYSIVAISAEQNSARKSLTKLQQSIKHIWKNFQEIDFKSIEIAIQKLTQFDQFFRSRKVEKYVIPAIKNATDEVNPLLAELEELSTFCVRILQSLPHRVHQALEQGLAKQKELRRAMELYCSNLQLRLVKEEQELLPLVQQVLTGEEIFELGAQFLSEDGKKLQDQQAKLEIELPVPEIRSDEGGLPAATK